MPSESTRLDHRIISELIVPGSSVLDLGCGEGDLLYMLIKHRGAHGQGIEIDEQAIYTCVARGLNVFHGDIDSGLSDYPDRSFDYVILNQMLTAGHACRNCACGFLEGGKESNRRISQFCPLQRKITIVLQGQGACHGLPAVSMV